MLYNLLLEILILVFIQANGQQLQHGAYLRARYRAGLKAASLTQ
jgi:hypothetical protein